MYVPGGKLDIFGGEPLHFRRRYYIVMSRSHYSVSCINARLECHTCMPVVSVAVTRVRFFLRVASKLQRVQD